MLNDLAIRILATAQTLSLKVRDERGQTLAEYGLIMAVIAVAVVVGAGIAFRDQITSAFESATNCLDGSC